nr:MAG TPA: hypothetical protein [Caudoviricetes sp.]
MIEIIKRVSKNKSSYGKLHNRRDGAVRHGNTFRAR